MLNSAKAQLETLLLLPPVLQTPEVLSQIKELQAQVIAEAVPAAVERRRNESSWGKQGSVLKTRKVVARRKKSVGSTTKLEHAAELSWREHQQIQRVITEQIEAAHREAQPPIVDKFPEESAARALRNSMPDVFIKSSKLSESNIDALSRIDTHYHNALINSAITISQDEGLNRKISYGVFPYQQGINKQAAHTLQKVRPTNNTVRDLLKLLVVDGFAFTPSDFSKPVKAIDGTTNRSNANAVGSYYSMVWMDYDDGKIAIEHFKELAAKYGFIGYESASSTEQHRKYRIGWILSKPIPWRLYVAAMSVFATLLWKETGSIDDKVTRRTSGLFFGSQGAAYYIPDQIKLYTIDESALDKALLFRERFIQKSVHFETRFSRSDTTIDLEALNENIKGVAAAGYAVRTKGTNTRHIYQGIIFPLAQMVLDGLITEDDGHALWADHFQDDENNGLQGLWTYGIDPAQGSGGQTIGTLIYTLKEVLGSAYRPFTDDESQHLPLNLSPSAKVDVVYRKLHLMDLPAPGEVQLEVSNTGCGKTHSTAEWLGDTTTAMELSRNYMLGQDLIILVHSINADSARAYREMKNAIIVNGRTTYQFRKSLTDKWTEVTAAHINGPEDAWLAANWNNTELVVRPNDPLNVQIKLLHSLGYDAANTTKDVMTIGGNQVQGASEYQQNQRAAAKKDKQGKVLVMAAAKFSSFMQSMNREVTALYNPMVIVDELAAFKAMAIDTITITAADLNKLPRMMQAPDINTVLIAVNAWFNHLLTAAMANTYPEATAQDMAAWVEKNHPEAARILRTTTAVQALATIIEEHNYPSLKSWNDAHGKSTYGSVYVTEAHQKLGLSILSTKVVELLFVLKQQLDGEKHSNGMSFSLGGLDAKGPHITITRPKMDIKALFKQCAFRIMAADANRDFMEMFTGCPVTTCAHTDFHGNSKMQNVRFHQYVMGGLSNHTWSEHTLHHIDQQMWQQKPEIVLCFSKHVDLLKSTSYIKAHPNCRVIYFFGSEMTGSNTASHLTRMMFIGSPIANISATKAELHALLGRSPSNNEVEAYIHNQTETAYQQAIGRLRGNRRQDVVLSVALLTGETKAFIAPCNGETTIDLEDESIWVSRTNMVDVRTCCPIVWGRIRDYMAEAAAEGDQHMPTIVEMCDALMISDETFRKACQYGGFKGIKDAWAAAKLVHKFTAIGAAMADALGHTDDYTERRDSLIAQISEYKAAAPRTNIEIVGAVVGLSVATWVEEDGSYPNLYFGCNNLMHDVMSEQQHAEMRKEWDAYSKDALMDEDARQAERLRMFSDPKFDFLKWMATPE